MSGITQGRRAKIIIVLAVAVMFALATCIMFTACSSNENEQSSNTIESSGTAHFIFDTNAVEGGELIEKDFGLAEGDTALDLLDHAGLSYELQESSYGNYVYSIEGIAQGDYGSMSGWLYYVNNEFAEEAADKYVVQDGDTISWIYSTGEEYA